MRKQHEKYNDVKYVKSLLDEVYATGYLDYLMKLKLDLPQRLNYKTKVCIDKFQNVKLQTTSDLDGELYLVEDVKSLLDEVIATCYFDYIIKKDEKKKQGKLADYVLLKNRINEVL